MKDLKDEFKGKLKVELQGFFEQYLGKLSTSSSTDQSPDKGNGVLKGPPPGFPPKELVLGFPSAGRLSTLARGDLGSFFQGGSVESISRGHKLECPRFNGSDFRG